jgi:glutaconate CoA-transferase subunit A
MACELLIAADAVSRVAAPFVGVEGVVAVGPAFRSAVQAGRVGIWECDESILLTALRAAAQRLPYLPWRGGVGTDLPRLNPALTEYRDEASGETLLRVPSRRLDVALLHALEADQEGNVRYANHSHFGDPALARAADRVIVEVERIVPHGAVLEAPDRTRLHRVDAVVVTRFGSHPYRAAGVLRQDDDWLRAWVKSIAATLTAGGAVGDAPAVARELELPDHEAYLAVAGDDRLRALAVDLPPPQLLPGPNRKGA